MKYQPCPSCARMIAEMLMKAHLWNAHRIKMGWLKEPDGEPVHLNGEEVV